MRKAIFDCGFAGRIGFANTLRWQASVVIIRHLLLLLAIISLPVFAADPWDTTDKVLGGTALAFELVDMAQTISISHSCHSNGAYFETNPILGKCPEAHSVVQYFAASILVTGVIANALPSTYRKAYLTGAVIFEFGFVIPFLIHKSH